MKYLQSCDTRKQWWAMHAADTWSGGVEKQKGLSCVHTCQAELKSFNLSVCITRYRRKRRREMETKTTYHSVLFLGVNMGQIFNICVIKYYPHQYFPCRVLLCSPQNCTLYNSFHVIKVTNFLQYKNTTAIVTVAGIMSGRETYSTSRFLIVLPDPKTSATRDTMGS